ncbi:hypothetical protein KC327_g36 [Hortaea werneckii]|nr:hypothetical protein KC327_g36 [Hortaea werneckii]
MELKRNATTTTKSKFLIPFDLFEGGKKKEKRKREEEKRSPFSKRPILFEQPSCKKTDDKLGANESELCYACGFNRAANSDSISFTTLLGNRDSLMVILLIDLILSERCYAVFLSLNRRSKYRERRWVLIYPRRVKGKGIGRGEAHKNRERTERVDEKGGKKGIGEAGDGEEEEKQKHS